MKECEAFLELFAGAKTKYWEKLPALKHFVHHKSHRK
jgi:hypothetical protein